MIDPAATHGNEVIYIKTSVCFPVSVMCKQEIIKQ